MLDLSTIQIQSLKSAWWKNTLVDVLRIDQVHPIVSGNKWFKLRYYIAEAKAGQHDTIATFGGAYSNHIVATAFACRQAGLRSVGFIRGEKPPHLSATLSEAMEYGMDLRYTGREAYRDKQEIVAVHSSENWYWVNEGGYGFRGMEGAATILQTADTGGYSHIVTACGTGTTLAGLVAASLPHQHCLGISVLKGHHNLEQEVVQLLPRQHQNRKFTLLHDYHFGGYAKHPPELVDWMNALWREEELPTDIVYTSKLVYAVKDLVEKGYFSTKDKILIIHSGGLQGNRSLPPGRLAFL